MPKATLEQWRMLQAVVSYGGFTQAAEAVHKSQSTVHHAVHKLEQQLGVTLLEVQGRKAVLTEQGSLLLRRAGNLLMQAVQLEDVAKGLSEGIEAQLKLSVDVIFPYYHLYRVLDRFSQQFPNTRVELLEAVLSGGEDHLKHGSSDIVITPFVPAGFIGAPIINIRFLPVAHKNHPLCTENASVALDDLASYRQIVLRDSGQAKRDSGWLGAEQRWTVTHMSTSVDIVKRGLGFAWLPETWISENLSNNELSTINLTENGERHVPLYLVYGNADGMGPACHYLGEQLISCSKNS